MCLTQSKRETWLDSEVEDHKFNVLIMKRSLSPMEKRGEVCEEKGTTYMENHVGLHEGTKKCFDKVSLT